MATTLAITNTSAKVVWTYESVLAWDNAVNSSSFSYSTSLTNGTGASQADRIYIASSTIAASTALDLDLAGAVTDIFGATITFARVKIIYFHLTTDTSSSGVTVGGHATAGLANWITSAGGLDADQPAVRVRNGGCFYLCAPDATGYAVTATTEDILTFTNVDGSNVATYNLVIVGASA